MCQKHYIYIPCPVCLAEGNNLPREFWRHAGMCQGRLYLDQYAFVCCESCKNHTHLSEVKLRCNNDRHDFVVSDVRGFASAISQSAQMVNGGGLAYLQSVLTHIKPKDKLAYFIKKIF